MRVRLAVTLGDPRGVGPEIVRKALASARVRSECDVVVVGPSGVEQHADEVIGEWHVDSPEREAGRLSGVAIERAVQLARDGAVQGIVTAPIDVKIKVYPISFKSISSPLEGFVFMLNSSFTPSFFLGFSLNLIF